MLQEARFVTFSLHLNNTANKLVVYSLIYASQKCKCFLNINVFESGGCSVGLTLPVQKKSRAWCRQIFFKCNGKYEK